MKTGERIKNYFKNFKFTADFALKCIAYLVLIAYIVLMAGGKKFFAPRANRPQGGLWRPPPHAFATSSSFSSPPI